MKTSTYFVALALFWLVAGSFAQTSSLPDSTRHVAARPGTEAARLELLHDTVLRALRDAESRLSGGRLDDAIAMAWVGLEQSAELPPSQERTSLIESLMLVVIDARVQDELSHDDRPNTGTRSHSPPGAPPRDPTTGLSTKAPPDRPSPLAEALTSLGEPPDLPDRVVVYPQDWRGAAPRPPSPQTPILYEGRPFQNATGETVQTVVYDVRTLVLPTPNFSCVPMRDLYEATRSAADRNALREGSAIFNGYADDLAAGIPLLGEFGGSCIGPADLGDGDREMAELVRLIDALTAP